MAVIYFVVKIKKHNQLFTGYEMFECYFFYYICNF